MARANLDLSRVIGAAPGDRHRTAVREGAAAWQSGKARHLARNRLQRNRIAFDLWQRVRAVHGYRDAVVR